MGKTWSRLTLALLLGLAPTLPVHAQEASPAAREIVRAALERTREQVTYDGSYRAIGYPGGMFQLTSGCAPIS